ncbi:lysyl oxidase homolog 2 [Adelges cooleyi]|uniref:lysyl oxidase homolog 2 n=1 Tax=Adelges cooleyi TaxID=133065 RepID=UPI00217FA548|nr:lysyl oxidase homolog 2 [Adelges cooleyi]
MTANKEWIVVWCCLVVFLILIGDSSSIKLAKKKKDKHWKARVISNHLKTHKTLEGMVRLVDADNEYEGNVEILHMGKWGAVCDDEWDVRDGQVVCRQLGFDRLLKVTHNSHFGQTTRSYWMDNIRCGGEEKELSDCRFDSWGESDCDPSEAAGVVCESSNTQQNITTTAPTEIPQKKIKKHKIKDSAGSNFELRLAGGREPQEGRVQVKTKDGWGVICGEGFGVLESMVVCRSMGLGYAAGGIYQTDQFGGLDDMIALSAVECKGDESGLEHCYHQRSADCVSKKKTVAAVMCVTEMADLSINADEIISSAYLEDKQMYFLQCAMEENCLASSAYQIRQEDSYNWHIITRRLLRFTAKITNVGTAPFRPAIPKHLWQFHQCHMHYHSMEVFATFDVMDMGGMKVAEGHKASFCLEDNQCTDGAKPTFACANYGDQGISVNCSDIYRHNIDCQWVDITDLNPGLYTFKVSVNPEYKIPEMTYTNNAVVCSMYYSETFVKIHDCIIQNP